MHALCFRGRIDRVGDDGHRAREGMCRRPIVNFVKGHTVSIIPINPEDTSWCSIISDAGRVLPGVFPKLRMAVISPLLFSCINRQT
jgi:hypothetical protein